MEGGGDGPAGKAALREGMTAFLAPLKDAARLRSWRWDLVCCGGRQDTFDAFSRAVRIGRSTIVALLVDAEAPVAAPYRAHLMMRDGWDLGEVSDDLVHLMIETMEAWIVADPAALSAYYGQRFNTNPLPRAANLEAVPKARLSSALQRATQATQKGSYHKIGHASDLLRRIDRLKVQQRCPGCARVFRVLGDMIAAA
jgi:hypothetical protein